MSVCFFILCANSKQWQIFSLWIYKFLSSHSYSLKMSLPPTTQPEAGKVAFEQVSTGRSCFLSQTWAGYCVPLSVDYSSDCFLAHRWFVNKSVSTVMLEDVMGTGIVLVGWHKSPESFEKCLGQDGDLIDFWRSWVLVIFDTVVQGCGDVGRLGGAWCARPPVRAFRGRCCVI